MVFRRDDKLGIPFPNMLDILGGGVEQGETPEEAISREMSEELFDLRTNKPFVLQGHKLFMVYTDKRGCEQHIYGCEISFEINDPRLLEGRELVGLIKGNLDTGLKLAFEFEEVLNIFFLQQEA